MDPRSKRALRALLEEGWPLVVEIEGEPFEVATERTPGGAVYFWLRQATAVDAETLRMMLDRITFRNEIRDLERLGGDASPGRVLTLDDAVVPHPGGRLDVRHGTGDGDE